MAAPEPVFFFFLILYKHWSRARWKLPALCDLPGLVCTDTEYLLILELIEQTFLSSSYYFLNITQVHKIKLAELKLAERLHNAQWTYKLNTCVDPVHLTLDAAAIYTSERILNVTLCCY